MLAQPALQRYVAREQMPGPAVETDEQIREFIRKWAKTDYHPVGTCKMGTNDLALVDPQLRVHGLDGLRVIDSSIMPNIDSTRVSDRKCGSKPRSRSFVCLAL